MKAAISTIVACLAALVGLAFFGEALYHLYQRDVYQSFNPYLLALTCVIIVCIALQAKRSSTHPR